MPLKGPGGAARAEVEDTEDKTGTGIPEIRGGRTQTKVIVSTTKTRGKLTPDLAS